MPIRNTPIGAAWCDFNLDGYVDLIVTNFFETRFHQLYKNNGNGTFTKIENSALALESEKSLAPILCDYDKDGDTDIFIPNGNNRPNSLFKNIGNFQFEKITAAPFSTDAYNSVGAAWGDYDNDGWHDLFVCNASNQNNNLYKNNGDGTFMTITGIAPVQDGGHSHGANWIDIDNDGDVDLFVTNDQS
ncbi:MAG: VCBS repeat-containing protein [Sphingobacteriales bacterium]|nr:VCBS repeat-containing protein [Sphingobacteriales bacterium]